MVGVTDSHYDSALRHERPLGSAERGFRAGRSAEGTGSETDGFGELLFRREERLGRLARARDPLAIITARVVLLLPVVQQGLPRLFGYARYRRGISQLWQAVTADAGCHANIKINLSAQDRNVTRRAK